MESDHGDQSYAQENRGSTFILSRPGGLLYSILSEAPPSRNSRVCAGVPTGRVLTLQYGWALVGLPERWPYIKVSEHIYLILNG
jgi:hypothetical protein